MNILFKPYATKSDINELLGGAQWLTVTKVFQACKKLENDPFNIQTNKVPSQIVFKVLGGVLREYKMPKKVYHVHTQGVKAWNATRIKSIICLKGET